VPRLPLNIFCGSLCEVRSRSVAKKTLTWLKLFWVGVLPIDLRTAEGEPAGAGGLCAVAAGAAVAAGCEGGSSEAGLPHPPDTTKATKSRAWQATTVALIRRDADTFEPPANLM